MDTKVAEVLSEAPAPDLHDACRIVEGLGYTGLVSVIQAVLSRVRQSSGGISVSARASLTADAEDALRQVLRTDQAKRERSELSQKLNAIEGAAVDLAAGRLANVNAPSVAMTPSREELSRETARILAGQVQAIMRPEKIFTPAQMGILRSFFSIAIFAGDEIRERAAR